MKLSIIYFSKTGKTRTMAEEVQKGMKTVENIEVRIFEESKELFRVFGKRIAEKSVELFEKRNTISYINK